jgi:hypothetical protein
MKTITAASGTSTQVPAPQPTVTDQQIEQWMTDTQSSYAKGTLPRWKIEGLEKIPDWYWA